MAANDGIPTAGRRRGDRRSHKPIRRALLVTVIVVGLGALMNGCALESGAGKGGVAAVLARLRPLAKDCDGRLNGWFDWDLSGSGRGDDALSQTRLGAVRDLADRVAACGGYVKVVAFSASVAETVGLGERAFSTEGGTETARLIQADKDVDALMGEVEDNLASARGQVAANGTDVFAQFQLAWEFQAQRSSGSLVAYVATDGIATKGPIRVDAAFDPNAVRSLATQVPMPHLADAEVRVFGIGHSVGPRALALTSEQIEGLVGLYDGACARAGAHCLVTTDYTKGS